MSSTVSTSARPAAAIADRRGTGLAGLWTLYVLTLRQHLHGKRWMVMVGLFLLPAVLAVVARMTAGPVPNVQGLEFLLAFMFIPQAILPLVALLYASGIIQDEQEEQTITYLLIRPIPKWAIYLVKLLATVTTTVLLTVIALAMTYAAVYVGSETPVDHIVRRYLIATGIQGLAMIAYCSVFGLLSLLTKRTLIVGVVYMIVVEGVLANLPFSIRLGTVIYYTRVIAYRALDFVVTTPQGSAENIGADAWQFDIRRDPDLLAHPTVATCIAVLLVSSFASALIGAVICSRREFHVKVPDVN